MFLLVLLAALLGVAYSYAVPFLVSRQIVPMPVAIGLAAAVLIVGFLTVRAARRRSGSGPPVAGHVPKFVITGMGFCLGLAYGYLGSRIVGAFPVAVTTVVWLGLVVAVFALMPIGVIALRLKGVSNRATDLFSWAAYLSVGLFSILLPLFVTVDVLTFVVSLIGRAAMVFSSGAENVLIIGGMTLYQAITIGVMAVAGIAMIAGLAGALCPPRVVTVKVPIAGLPEALEGFRIVQLTDIHLGATIKRRFIERVVERVGGLAPDMIAITGDLADGTVAELRDDAAPIALLQAPQGVYFVTGNHEYYSDLDGWLAEIAGWGITVLDNAHRVIERDGARLLIAGVNDHDGGHGTHGHRSDPAAAREGAPDCAVSILLAHQPRSIAAAARAGYDLQISGHTHGGQYYPWNWFVRLQQPFTHGLHRWERTWVYVSRGTGYWGPPLRIGQPAEITLLVLTSENS